jgi:hypothetical protein
MDKEILEVVVTLKANLTVHSHQANTNVVIPTNSVGANLIFDSGQKPKSNLCSEINVLISDIGSFLVFVLRAKIRFAPTLFSDIGWNSVLV